jgi:hypothetical protein
LLVPVLVLQEELSLGVQITVFLELLVALLWVPRVVMRAVVSTRAWQEAKPLVRRLLLTARV